MLSATVRRQRKAKGMAMDLKFNVVYMLSTLLKLCLIISPQILWHTFTDFSMGLQASCAT